MNFDKFLVINDECDDKNLQSDDILNELKLNKNERDLKTFQKLLTCPLKTCNDAWQPVLLELLKITVDNEKKYIEQKRLASRAFFTIISTSHSIDEQINCIKIILSLNNSKLILFNKELDVPDVESFKLNIIHAYLTNTKIIPSINIFNLLFDVIKNYCMTYTKHIYYAFKLLDIWLKKSRDINFWFNNDLTIENNLQAIIFSNWDNCISDIVKINAFNLFPIYLEIMKNKYKGFLEYALKITTEYLSWQCQTKFIIIGEICRISQSYPTIPHLEFNIFQSITKSHLRYNARKLYLILLEKMDVDLWNKLIRDQVYLNAKKWEFENNHSALRVLWELWMKPTLKKFKDTLIPSLWVQFFTDGTAISASYLIKIASELGTTWKQLISQSNKCNNNAHHLAMKKYWRNCKSSELPFIIHHAEEFVGLNIFTAYCHMKDFLDHNDSYKLCKSFLYFNISNCSMRFRTGLFDNFQILFGRIVKIRGSVEMSFVKWLHSFILDCFEPGSCYQRIIIGLKLFEIILMYVDGFDGRTKQKLNVEDGILLKEAMKEDKNFQWDFDNKFTLYILLRLCLNSIDEIREYSFNIVNNYFNMDDLTEVEVETLTLKAIEMSKSAKFYEIAGSVKLMLLLQKNKSTRFHTDLHESLFKNAKISLEILKTDFLSALTNGCDFNASIIALLELKFYKSINNSQVNELNSENFFQKLLDLMEDATIFFLSALSPKSSDVIYSSSFAEMGIAIEETIKTSAVMYKFDENVVSPAHQIVLSCIWMALKALCDLAAKISTLSNIHSNVKRSVDLIVSVLLKCRHKGAIEAAGVALGVSVHHLADKNEYNSLIDTYLNKLLCLNSNDKIDLTRRGAGLSIMFHRIISNDDKKTRRLLHESVTRLIKSLRDPRRKSFREIDSNQDCAYARQIHFLRTIVADKTLHPHLVGYMEEISMICFEYLQSLEWAIRNASLQLLGALIPRLVGQSSESELDFGNGYSINHFYTHYPVLAAHVLHRVTDPSAFNIDSNMVPIITLISKMSVSHCDFVDYSSKEYAEKLRNAMRILFCHSVDHVRYAAAKAYAALVSICEIPKKLFDMKRENLEDKNRNFIHGHHMAQLCLYLSGERAGIWSKNFLNNEDNVKVIVEAHEFQLKRVKLIVDHWLNCDDGKINEKSLCNVIEATFLQCLNVTSFWSDIGDKSSVRFLSLSKFLIIVERASMKNNIGVSEFLDQLFQLNLFIIEELNLNLIFDCCKSIYRNVRYYSIKHLHRKIIDKQLSSFHTINFIRDLIEIFLTFASIQDSDECTAIEICEVVVLILNQWRNWAEIITDKYCYNFKSMRDSLLDCAKFCKNKKVRYSSYKILVVLISKISNSELFTLEVQRYIKDLIDNGDEWERIAAIDLLMYSSFTDCCNHEVSIVYKFLLESFIALLSDKNDDVRKVLYEKMCNNHWPNWDYIIDDDNNIEHFIHFPSRYSMNSNVNAESLIIKNIQLLLYHAIFIFSVSLSPISLCKNYKWLPQMLQCNVPIKINERELKSPFDEDEIYHEVTKTFNIYYLFKKYNPSILYSRVDYTKIIEMGNIFFKNYINYLIDNGFTNLQALLHFDIDDYLYFKSKIYENEYFP